jgi:leucyl-tRNA synthetase
VSDAHPTGDGGGGPSVGGGEPSVGSGRPSVGSGRPSVGSGRPSVGGNGRRAQAGPHSTASYDPPAIEQRHQEAWAARESFRTPLLKARESGIYIKASAPFTSGNVHIGHVRSYAIGDAYARFQRARGEHVLFAFGFDAFGLPAELGAIAGGESPADWVARCAEHMTGQLQRLGFSFDWERTFMSSDAIMYRWSQWLFLTLLDAGLIYRGSGSVDWCDTCQTTLATIQVENGACWRCHDPVRLIQRPQWYLRISAYLQENDRRLQELQKWDDTSLASQRFVLGRVDGVELQARAEDDRTLTVFTPHADALAKARFVLISPKHPEVERWIAGGAVEERLEEMRLGGLERSARGAEAVALLDSGVRLRLGRADPSPSSSPSLPLLISPAVDERFGATAVLGIPELDRTDELIAERLGIVFEEEEEGRRSLPADAAGAGTAVGHGSAAGGAIRGARPAVRYKAGDFSISRQRSWGTPIPIVYCERCGTVPVPREQLPVQLPRDLIPTGEGNPLAERADFVETSCPRCGGAARRETDTLDCHFDALWLWIPACVPAPERERSLEGILALPDLRAWLPSERLVAGSDSGNFMFDQRITTKALRDIGPLAFLADGEPFAGALMHEMVIRDGRKMSKHLGNVVDPDELVGQYGADTVRLAVLWAARPQKSLNWSDSAVQFCHRFLHSLWQYSHARFAQRGEELGERDPRRTEHLRRRLQKWCDTAVEKITEELSELEMHSAVRNVIRLLDRIKDYEKRVLQHSGSLGRDDHEVLIDALGLIARLLIPFAPHIGTELWEASGLGAPGVDPPWPAPGEWSRQRETAAPAAAVGGDTARMVAAAHTDPDSAEIHRI